MELPTGEIENQTAASSGQDQPDGPVGIKAEGHQGPLTSVDQNQQHVAPTQRREGAGTRSAFQFNGRSRREHRG
jgi:hypothetical protein